MVKKENYNAERIFYDPDGSEFLRININEEELQFVYPNKDKVYFTVEDESKWEDIIEEFDEVDTSVVEDPDDYLERWVSKKISKGTLDIDLLYAYENTEFSKKE